MTKLPSAASDGELSTSSGIVTGNFCNHPDISSDQNKTPAELFCKLSEDVNGSKNEVAELILPDPTKAADTTTGVMLQDMQTLSACSTM